MTNPALEAAARAYCCGPDYCQYRDGGVPYSECQARFKERKLRAAIAAWARNVVVSETVWDGLPRDIMMCLDMEPKTPRALFRHLENCGREIPQWLRDEPEMKALDHVPSKGTRVVLIVRAALSQAADELEQDNG